MYGRWVIRHSSWRSLAFKQAMRSPLSVVIKALQKVPQNEAPICSQSRLPPFALRSNTVDYLDLAQDRSLHHPLRVAPDVYRLKTKKNQSMYKNILYKLASH